MRRLYVRGADNVNKRVLVQAAAFNIGLLLRKLTGWGKPRQGQGRTNGILAPFCAATAVQGLFVALRKWAAGFFAPVCPGIMTPPGYEYRFP